MACDIVERLRHPMRSDPPDGNNLDERTTVDDMAEAADEIDRLRAALASARADALEEAARTAERLSAVHVFAADAIRALKETPHHD